MEICCRAGQATDDIIGRRKDTICMPGNKGNNRHTHIQGVPRVKVTTSGECSLC